MQSATRASLMSCYQQLPDRQKAVMAILSVNYAYCTISTLGNCLHDLGFKDGKNKPLKNIDLKPDFDALLATGLIEEHPNYGTRRCARLIAESITRQLINDNQFERYAKLIDKHVFDTRGKYFYYTSPDDCLRDMRLYFHREEYAKADACLEKIHTQMPGSVDIYLSWLLNPLDIAWLISRHPVIAKQLVGYILLHQSLYLYDTPPEESLLHYCLKEGTLTDIGLVVRLCAELFWLRGDWPNLEKLLANNSAHPELQAISAALTFLRGDTDTAIKQFEAALSSLRKLTSKRTAYFQGFAGVFYPLALLKAGDDSQKSKLATLLNQAVKQQTYWTRTYLLLASFQQFLQGDLAKRSELLSAHVDHSVPVGFMDNGEPASFGTKPTVQGLLVLLIKFWVQAEYLQPNSLNSYAPLYQYVLDNGYLWVTNEFAQLLNKPLSDLSKHRKIP
jgi:hypothetical protein